MSLANSSSLFNNLYMSTSKSGYSEKSNLYNLPSAIPLIHQCFLYSRSFFSCKSLLTSLYISTLKSG